MKEEEEKSALIFVFQLAVVNGKKVVLSKSVGMKVTKNEIRNAIRLEITDDLLRLAKEEHPENQLLLLTFSLLDSGPDNKKVVVEPFQTVMPLEKWAEAVKAYENAHQDIEGIVSVMIASGFSRVNSKCLRIINAMKAEIEENRCNYHYWMDLGPNPFSPDAHFFIEPVRVP